MDCKRIHVSPDRFDLANQTFKITTNSETANLALSISAIGLLQPPLVIEENERLVVVCGFRRLAALLSLAENRIPVQLLPPSTPRSELAVMAISDNTYQRDLNVVEQSRGYALIKRHCDPAEDWRRLADLSGLPGSGKAMARILPVVEMPQTLQDTILDGGIALPVAQKINRLADNDKMAMIALFRQISAGLNVQRELFDLATEISRRDGVSIASLLSQRQVASILENDQTPTPQKVQQLRGHLKRMRFPELSRTEQAYNQTIKQLRLSPRIQIQPPPFFEGKTYRVTLSVESRRQLKSLQDTLDQIIASPDLLPE